MADPLAGAEYDVDAVPKRGVVPAVGTAEAEPEPNRNPDGGGAPAGLVEPKLKADEGKAVVLVDEVELAVLPEKRLPVPEDADPKPKPTGLEVEVDDVGDVENPPKERLG